MEPSLIRRSTVRHARAIAALALAWGVFSGPASRSALGQAPTLPADSIARATQDSIARAQDAALDAALMNLMSRNRPAAETLVRGTIVDGTTGAGVGGALVQFVRDDLRHTTQTDADGSFTLAAIHSGPYRMTVEHLAYVKAEDDVEVSGGGVVTHVRVALSPDAIALSAIQVIVDSRPTFGMVGAAYDRVELQERMGLGRFFDRTRIEESGAFAISDMLTMLPGVRVQDNAVVFNTVTPGCGTPLIFIDGVRMAIPWSELRSTVSLPDVELLEIYRRPAEIPAEYSGSDSACGVLAIWTRRG